MVISSQPQTYDPHKVITCTQTTKFLSYSIHNLYNYFFQNRNFCGLVYVTANSFWPVWLYQDLPTHEGKGLHTTVLPPSTHTVGSSSAHIVTCCLIFHSTGCPVVQFHFYRLPLNRTKPFHLVSVSTPLNTPSLVMTINAYSYTIIPRLSYNTYHLFSYT